MYTKKQLIKNCQHALEQTNNTHIEFDYLAPSTAKTSQEVSALHFSAVAPHHEVVDLKLVVTDKPNVYSLFMNCDLLIENDAQKPWEYIRDLTL